MKSISIPIATLCGKEVKLGDGSWECKDCELVTCTLYCNDCFMKEKHIGHKFYFNPGDFGFCDCGKSSDLKPEGFCDKHKGDYDNMKDLMNFIKSSIDEKLLGDINDIFNKIILLFIDKIKSLEEVKNLEEKENNDEELYEMIDYLESFCDKLYKNNLSLLYFFTLKFTENFPYETNHKCFSYDEDKNLITFIKKDREQKHTCICPFLQVIIYVLMKRKTKQNSHSFFNLFLQTYKNRIVTSICFFNTFSELFYDDNLKIFREMEYQLINESLGILLYKDNNIMFLETFFEEIYSVSEKFLEEKKYQKLKEIIFIFYQFIKDLPYKSIIDKMNYNIKILNIIINICCLPNNTNEFENKIKFENFQKDKFESNLLNAELYGLLIIKHLIRIINFDNEETIKSIFNNMFVKLKEFKIYKEKLSNKKFSPHLTSIKCFALLVNRFCFNYSIKHECDLLDSFNYFQKRFPQSKELNEFLFEELINLFGFIISQLYSYFKYFGEKMITYYMTYFDSDFIDIKCDITLFKYLLTQPEIIEKFNIKNILRLSDIDSSNAFLSNLFDDNLNKNNIEVKDDSEQNNLKYFNSLLEFLYLIIRDNLSMEKIIFNKVDFQAKIKDELYEKIYLNEKDRIKTLVKNDIIHFILGKENLVRRDECIEYISKTYADNFIDLVDELIKKDCVKRVSMNGLTLFSLKKEILNLYDMDYIIDVKSRKNAIEYLTDFQSNNYDISNIYIIESLNIEKKLMKNVYQAFYNAKNIDELIK